jgi:hypothetical protein
MSKQKMSRPAARQLFLDQAIALVPGFTAKLEELEEQLGSRDRAIAAWRRHFHLEGKDCDWAADSGAISLAVWHTGQTGGDRRLFYMLRNLTGAVPTFVYKIKREFYLTSDIGHFRESIHAALDEKFLKFIATLGLEYVAPPPPSRNIALAMDCLVLRICRRMPTAQVLERVFPCQDKAWSTVFRDIQNAAQIVGIRTPPPGRPKTSPKK